MASLATAATCLAAIYNTLPKATRDALLNAPSIGQYFNANIKADDRNENGPYDCRTHKVPSYQ